VYAVLAMSSSACSSEPASVDRASVEAHELPATLSLAASDFWIEVTPDSATVAPGGVVQLSAIGRSRDGLRWTIHVIWQAPAGGAVSASGQYVAPQTPGRYPVVATREGDVQTDTAFVRVLTTASQGDFWIEVTPDTVTATPGDTLQFTALGHSADGAQWTVRTVWQASAGSVSETGSYVTPDTAGTYRVVATRVGDVQADTAIVRVAPASGAVTAAVTTGCTNEPAGYRRVATASWDQLPGRQPEVSSDYMTYFHDQIPTLSIVQDAAAPASPSSVLRVLYPAGFRGGESPSRWGTSSLGENGGNLYVCLWIRYDPWWSTEGITMDKLFYVHQNDSRLNHAMVALGEYNDLFIHALLQFPTATPHYNIGQVKSAENNVAGGGWHKVEVVWEANVPGQRNGRYRHWVDDRLIATADDAYWFEGGNTPHWDTVWFDPIYGRTESVIPRDQSWYMDQTVVSVK